MPDVVRGATGGGWSDRARSRPPELPPHLVVRPRIDELLDLGRSRLTVVVGPAGAGKTVAVASWAVRSGRPVAWLTLQGGDDDRIWPLVGSAVAGRFHLEPPSTDDVESLASWLEVAVADEKPVVVLDDLHCLQDRRRIAELEGFVRYLPPDVRFVLVARPPVQMRLHRLRLWGEVDEITADDLRFDADEVAALLGADDGIAAALREHTGGWPAVTWLAGTRAIDGAPIDAAVAGAVGAVIDHELGARGTEAERVLIALTVLGPSSRERLAAAAGAERLDVALDDLGHHGPGLVEPDGDQVRVSPTAARALAIWVAAARADLAGEVRHRAAEWHMQRGEVEPALDELMTAADDVGMRLLADNAMRLHMEGRTHLLRKWLAPLEAADVTGTVTTRIAVAAALAVVGRADDAARVIMAADIDSDSALTPAVEGVLARCHQLWGEPDVALELLERAIAGLGPSLGWVAADRRFHLQRLYLLLELGELEQVRAGYLALPANLPASAWLDAVMAPSVMALLELLDGNLSAAVEIAQRARAAAVRVANDTEHLVDVELVLGKVALARREPTARQHLTSALGHARTGGGMLKVARAAAALARLEQADGAVDAALATIADARRPRHVRPLSPRAAAMLDVAEARIHLVAGDADAADACIARLPDRDATVLLAAWSALLRGDERGVAELLDSLIRPLTRPLEIDRWLLAARLASSTGDVDAAVGHVRRAITLGWPDRRVLPFVEHGRDVEPLLRRARDGSRSSAYIHSLLDAIAGAAEVALPASTDRLTDRELDVLRRMARNMSNAEIAAVLGISVNTLKSHAKAIYRKLGVQSRAEAIDLARRLALGEP